VRIPVNKAALGQDFLPVLLGMIDKLIEIGSCYGMEMNVEKTRVMRISRQPS